MSSHYHKLRPGLADRLDLITASISISYVVMLQQLKLNVAAFLSRISQVQTLRAKFRFQPSAPARNYVAVLSLSSEPAVCCTQYAGDALYMTACYVTATVL